MQDNGEARVRQTGLIPRYIDRFAGNPEGQACVGDYQYRGMTAQARSLRVFVWLSAGSPRYHLPGSSRRSSMAMPPMAPSHFSDTGWSVCRASLRLDTQN